MKINFWRSRRKTQMVVRTAYCRFRLRVFSLSARSLSVLTRRNEKARLIGKRFCELNLQQVKFNVAIGCTANIWEIWIIAQSKNELVSEVHLFQTVFGERDYLPPRVRKECKTTVINKTFRHISYETREVFYYCLFVPWFVWYDNIQARQLPWPCEK